MQQIVIIGGGLSGMLLTLNLLRRHHRINIFITVIDKNPPGLLGQAYSTDNPIHLLNVPAHKMSAFPDLSEDFYEWLTDAGYDFHDRSFVPRKIYKQYILDLLKKELSERKGKVRYTWITGRALDIVPSEQVILLESGARISFDKVILALGNFNPAPLRLDNNAYLLHPGYFPSAWDDQVFKDLPRDNSVVIIGTGLTMVDTLLSLRQREHKGPIRALSIHGLTPMAHQEGPSYQIDDIAPKDIHSTLDALKLVRRHIDKAREQGIGWRAVIDAVRPYTQEIWLGLSIVEKRKFMEHLRHIWGVARHRLATECSSVLQAALAEGQFSILAGRVRSILVRPDKGFSVQYQERHTHELHLIAADKIINCMGPESNYERSEEPLIRNLLGKGLIRTDALKLGIDCTREGVVIENDGKPSSFLFTIGPPAKGVLWEITSVPEIRVAAVRLADSVVSKKDTFAFQSE
jgi:uncharacterized NAD(P)/FAD-binding protein YdhS